MDASEPAGVFDITSASATVTISGLTISGGYAEDGGGILDQGGALTLASDTLTKDHAIGVNPGDTVQGGAVEVTDSGSLTVTNCGFTHDLAVGAGERQRRERIQQWHRRRWRRRRDPRRRRDEPPGHGHDVHRQPGDPLRGRFRRARVVENGFGGYSNGSAIDSLGVAFSVTDSSFTGDLSLGGACATGLNIQQYSASGFGGDASGTINVASLAAASPFTFSGDTFQDEQIIGGAGANNVVAGVANYGGFGGSNGGVINNNDGIPDMSIQNCNFTLDVSVTVGGGDGVLAGSGVMAAATELRWSLPAAT